MLQLVVPTQKVHIPASRGRIVALDGLRGFAALVVVFHHCFIWPILFSKGITSNLSFRRTYGHNILLTGLWYGFSGVELFFLLSGFCLFFPIFSHPQKAFNVREYAVHRFRRIYPPYFASLCVAVSLAAIAWSRIDAHLHYATEPITILNVATAVTLTQSHFCLPFWTLVVEAQWYFIVPLLAILWKRSRWTLHAGMLLVIVLTTALAKTAPMLHLGFVDVGGLAMYLPLFWIGIAIAEVAAMNKDRGRILLRRGGWLLLLFLGLLAIYAYVPLPPIWTQTRAQAYPFGIFYAGVLAAALFTEFGKRLFSAEWLVKVGGFSYSLYLIHALVVYVAIVVLDHYRISGQQELIVCLSILPAICIGAGYVFYLAVEGKVQVRRPFRKQELEIAPVSLSRPTAWSQS